MSNHELLLQSSGVPSLREVLELSSSEGLVWKGKF